MNLVTIIILISQCIRSQINYINSGSDWSIPSCTPTINPNQSPVDMYYMNCNCQAYYQFELVFNQTRPSVSSITLSGFPSTIRTKVNSDFAFAVFRSESFKTRLYYPTELIFRTPSEHTQDQSGSAIELQIFFKSTNDLNLAVSVFFDISLTQNSSVIFSDFLSLISNPKNVLNSTNTIKGKLNNAYEYNSLFPDELTFYYYNGTFTDNNCSRGLEWVVLNQRLTVNSTDLAIYQQILQRLTPSWNNSRGLQNLQNRSLFIGGVACSDFYSNLLWFAFFFVVIFGILFKSL